MYLDLGMLVADGQGQSFICTPTLTLALIPVSLDTSFLPDPTFSPANQSYRFPLDFHPRALFDPQACRVPRLVPGNYV